MKNPELRTRVLTAAVFVLCTCGLSLCGAQESAPMAASQPGDSSLRDMASQLRELRAVIEQMRSENAFDYFLCPLWNQYVQLRRRDVQLIGQRGPI